jgi:hypothetical protein
MNLERQNLQIVNFADAVEKSAFVRKVQSLNGKFWVKITKYQRRRSLEQNAFYWGVVLPLVCGGIAEAWGEPIMVDEAHLLMKTMFLSRPIIDHRTGEQMGRVPPSSAKLNVQEFSNYIEQISQFAAASLGCVMPEAVVA